MVCCIDTSILQNIIHGVQQLYSFLSSSWLHRREQLIWPLPVLSNLATARSPFLHLPPAVLPSGTDYLCKGERVGFSINIWTMPFVGTFAKLVPEGIGEKSLEKFFRLTRAVRGGPKAFCPFLERVEASHTSPIYETFVLF